MRKILGYSSTVAFVLLCAWCFLPILMSFITLAYNFLGLLPSEAEIIADGFTYGGFNYNEILDVYYTLFYILGAITVLFVALVFVTGNIQFFNKENFKKKPWYYILFTLLLWSTLCAIVSDDPYTAFFGNYYLCDNLCSYYIYASVFVCSSLITDQKKKFFLIKFFLGMVLYNAIIMIVQETTQLDILVKSFSSARAVVFNQFNHFGYMLCMALIGFACFYLYENKIIYLVLYTIIAYALIMNDTFGSYLASIMAFPFVYLIYGFSNHKLSVKKFLPLFIFILLSVLSIFEILPCATGLSVNVTQFGSDVSKISSQEEGFEAAGTGRMQLWLDTIEKIKERPIFGFGPLGFTEENAITNGDSPHNEYLQIAGLLGLPGLGLYLSALILLCVDKVKNLKHLSTNILISGSMLIVYLCSACFGNPVYNTYPYFWLSYGLTLDGSLFDLGSEEIFHELTKQNDKKHFVKTVVIALVSAVVFFFAFITYLNYQTEISFEKADLETMNCAKIQAQIYLQKSEKIELDTIYYFDVSTFSLVTEKPQGYGYGTSIDGKGIEKDTANSGFNYDGSKDYTDSVVQIIIHSSDDIEVEWVD